MATGFLDNYYARLGVSKDASPKQIREAYHKAARLLHPDTTGDESTTDLFLQVQEAYEILSNPQKRIAYDKTLPDNVDPPTDVLINAIYSRPSLPVMKHGQLLYVLLDFLALPEDDDRKTISNPPLNIGLVLDTSTSMSGPRLEMVKATANELIDQLESQDIISVVSFNDKAEVVLPATRAVDKKRLQARINLLQARGATEIYQGLNTGFEEVNLYNNENQVSHLILVTDGRTYGDEEDCLKLADKAAKRGITISGMGIGHEWNDDLIDNLANRTGGSSHFATKPEDIRKLLGKQFSQLTHTFANNIKLQYKTAPNVELRYAFRLAPDSSVLEKTSPISLSYIPLERSLSVLFEFLITNITSELPATTIMEGSLSLTIPTRAIPNMDKPFELIRPIAIDPESSPPPQVLVKALSRLSMYRMQEQAQNALSDGDINKATTRLDNLASQLLESGQPELAHTIKLEIEKLKSGDSISEEAKKQIKYGTRSLILPDRLNEDKD